MLTVEQNEELTKVGPGTPMGELLRRYWYPIAFEQDFDSVPTKTVRLLSENWTLFKTPKGGKYGIVREACPHRSASLTYGVVHEDGIRCGYHGWKWDFEGNCVEQPAEADNQNFRDRVKQKAGKAQVMGGMIWVYVGPEPAPELPRFDVFVMDGIKDCGYATLPCNWLQIMENSVDPHHVEWLHGYYFDFMGQTQGFDAPKAFQKKHLRTGFEEMEWASSSAACWRVARRKTTTGRSGIRLSSPTSCAWVGPVSTRCRSVCLSMTRPRGSSSIPTTPPTPVCGSRRTARRSTNTCGVTRKAASSPTTSRARTSWPG
ncbi:MAG: Rieske 2Fe-2S domain-containing protein [Candidatus Nanopelagicales bacterium]